VWERPLRRSDIEALGETITEAWLARAPKRLVTSYLDER
jgi:hypothetical protein